MGFDPDIVDALAVTSSDIEAGVIANSRVNNLSPLNVSDTIMTGDNETDKLWLHENYIKTSVLGRDELLQVFTVQNQIIDVNIVNEVPFSTFTPFPIPGSLWGESVYDVTKDLQDLGTSALRLVIDNGINANFRRYVAVKGAYDRQSLMNNRPGSVIEAQSIDAVQPFPHHPLPQGIDLLFNYVDQEKESRTGVNKAGQGLDPAVFKNDNSTATVQMVMTAALNRVRMVARN
ncbi:portal protein, partial [Herbiconiux daphne]